MPSVVTWHVFTPTQGSAEGSMTRLRHKWTTYIGKGSKAKVVVLSDALIKNVEAPSRERCLCADVSILSDSRQKKSGCHFLLSLYPGI